MATSDSYHTNNKRIAKNTLYLYLRMLLVLVVSLFTVRVNLNSLGVVDYGIHNVVGGVVTMLAFLSSTLNSASLRFFAVSIGKNDQESLSKYFSISFWCYLILAIFILLIAETVGLWFVSTQLTIPAERMDAAYWVYHFSILQFIVNILVIPFSSIVIAHEKMNVFAVSGVIECVLKLLVAYVIVISPFDKLKTYAVLLFFMMFLKDGYYVVYGLKHFAECRIKRYWDKTTIKEIVSYSGWTLFGTISGIVRGQGINILLNMFFNPVVNAARGIAYQISNHINNFVLSFHKAVQPQITKSYGAGDIQNMLSLVYRASRFNFFLIFFLSLPFLLEIEYILLLWLKTVPDYTALFTRLVIITAMVDSTSYPLQSAISATGKIRLYQAVTGSLLILNLPVAWIFLKCGYPPQITMYVAISISIIAQVVRIFFAHALDKLSIRYYIKKVIIPIALVILLSSIIPFILHFQLDDGLTRFLIVSIASLVSSACFIWFVGITKDERKSLRRIIISKFTHRQ